MGLLCSSDLCHRYLVIPYVVVVGGKIGRVAEEFPTKWTFGQAASKHKNKKGGDGVQYSDEF